jgi:hypothetical protein
VTDLTDQLQIRPATIDDLGPYLAAFERIAGFKLSLGR